MEIERRREHHSHGGGGSPPEGDPLAETRPRLESLLSQVDSLLDGIRPVNAESYLQQNRQNGGQ